jgi:hypothetical protein
MLASEPMGGLASPAPVPLRRSCDRRFFAGSVGAVWRGIAARSAVEPRQTSGREIRRAWWTDVR